MAHFAELDENNVVKRVITINNRDTSVFEGEEDESIGIAFCKSRFGGTKWVQTSYNNNFRKRFAGIGFTYDAERDAFITPKPANHPSFILDEEELTWVEPIPRPTDSIYYLWDEPNVRWREMTQEEREFTDRVNAELEAEIAAQQAQNP